MLRYRFTRAKKEEMSILEKRQTKDTKIDKIVANYARFTKMHPQ